MTPLRLFRVLLACVLVLSAAFAFSQENRATISGSVVDPSGAAVPGAIVTALEVRTGVKTPTKSDATGNYNIPFLAPGQYTISVEAPNFRNYDRKGVALNAGDHQVIDVKLTLGQASESVTVTEAAPILQTANSSTGQTITTKEVEDVPLNGRNPLMIAQLAIGVIPTGQPALVHPFDNAAASAWSIGGTPSQTSEILMDGAPNGTWDNRAAYAPPQDSVQEVKVKAFDSDASYGHTQSGTINEVMKTGTNNLHGSAYWFTQPSSLAANDYFAKRAGVKPQPTKLNQYGFTAGGPMYVPKVFNGKNKLFWFLGMEKFTDSQPNAKFLTVPTDAERGGDFSSLLSVPGGGDCLSGANATGYNCYQLFNPYTGFLNGKVLTRAPFYCDASGNPMAPDTTPGSTYGTQAVGTPCNKIPQQLLSPVALAYLKFYPQPNTTGDATGYSNYANSITTNDNYNNELGRLDWAMSDRSRLAFDVRHNVEMQSKNNYFGNNTTGSLLKRENWGGTLDEVFTINPTTVIDARANYTHFGEGHPSPSAGFDPTTLGFPSYINSNSEYLQLPGIRFGSSCGSDSTQATSFDCFGSTGANLIPSTSYQLYGNVEKQWRTHTLKFGVDTRKYILDAQNFGNSAGTYSFNNSWTSGPTSDVAVDEFGQDFAAFVMGLPSSGSFDLNARGTFHSYYYAFFAQDDWRITHTLTLNLGVRYDHDTPYSEKSGRTVNGFAIDATNPVAAAAIAAYNKKPIPQIPSGSFQVPGGLTFASASNGAIWQNDTHMVSPRFGFAWSPDALHGNTVFRGGFGIFVQPLTMAVLNPVGKYSSSPILTQEGFSQTTDLATSSSYISPDASPTGTLSDPFPNGFLQPVGAADGLATFDGLSVNFLAPKQKNPYSERWTFGIQHAFTPNLVMEVAYIGNHALHLPVAFTQLNGIPTQYLSTLPYRDQAVITALTAKVTNPFKGLLPGTKLNSSTIATSQLLAPFPEFPVASDSTSVSSGVVEQNATIGSSSYNSLNVRVEKRMSHGLSVIANYSWSKLMEQDSWLNVGDTHLEKRISPFDHTHHFVIAVDYDLPIGQGKLLNLNSGVLNALVGGWVVNGVYSHQTGAPLLWENGSSNNPGDYPLCAVATNNGICPADANGVPQYAAALPALPYNNRLTIAPAFDTENFVTSSKGQFQYHIRTMPTTFSQYRADGINNFDASLIKNFHITESKYFQFRLEAFNLLNHPTFGAPNMKVNNKSFGTINSMANRPRQLQLGMRFVF